MSQTPPIRAQGPASENTTCKMTVGTILLSITAVACAALAIVAFMKQWGMQVYVPSGSVAGIAGLAAIALIICRVKKTVKDSGNDGKKYTEAQKNEVNTLYASLSIPVSEQPSVTTPTDIMTGYRINQIRNHIYQQCFHREKDAVIQYVNQLSFELFELIFLQGSIEKLEDNDTSFNAFLVSVDGRTKPSLPSLFEYIVYSQSDQRVELLSSLLQKLGPKGLSDEALESVRKRMQRFDKQEDKESIKLILNKCSERAREELFQEALKQSAFIWLEVFAQKWTDGELFREWDAAKLLEAVFADSSDWATVELFLSALESQGRDVTQLSFNFSIGPAKTGSLLFLAIGTQKVDFVKGVSARYPALLTKKADSLAEGFSGAYLPIFRAIEMENLELVKAISSEANGTIQVGGVAYTPITYAERRGAHDIVDHLATN